MIKEMYKRRERVGYVFLGILILIIVGWTLLQTPDTTVEWLEMLFFLIPLVMIVTIIIISRSHYKKVKDIEIVHSQQTIHDLNHVVIKNDVSFTPRLLLFEKDGKFIGVVKPLNIPWWMFPFLIFNATVLEFFPLSYELISHDGEIQFIFRKNGWLKQTKLTIFNRENKEIGTYIQEEFKALFNIKGELFNEDKVSLLSIKSSGFSGDFSWNDEEGNRWAYFYNGKFPHEYTNIFRDTDNDIVELSDKLSERDKILLLAVIGYLFMTRINK